MIRKKEEATTSIVIDLTGPEGNACCLLAYAKQYCKQRGLNYAEVREKMVSSDYENLVKVFDEYFGDYVILER